MTIRFEVQTRREGVAIQHALNDPKTRAFLVIVGTLLPLPNDRARTRVLRFVEDRFKDDARDDQA